MSLFKATRAYLRVLTVGEDVTDVRIDNLKALGELAASVSAPS